MLSWNHTHTHTHRHTHTHIYRSIYIPGQYRQLVQRTIFTNCVEKLSNMLQENMHRQCKWVIKCGTVDDTLWRSRMVRPPSLRKKQWFWIILDSVIWILHNAACWWQISREKVEKIIQTRRCDALQISYTADNASAVCKSHYDGSQQCKCRNLWRHWFLCCGTVVAIITGYDLCWPFDWLIAWNQ